MKEAPPGFEPGMADLQSAALPLGEGALNLRHVSGRPDMGQPRLILHSRSLWRCSGSPVLTGRTAVAAAVPGGVRGLASGPGVASVLLEVAVKLPDQLGKTLEDEQVLGVLVLGLVREIETAGDDRRAIDHHNLVMCDGVVRV